MNSLIDAAARLHSERQADAAELYRSWLHGPPAEPTEADAGKFLNALGLLGLSVADAGADAATLDERRRLDSRRAAAQAVLDTAPAERTALLAQNDSADWSERTGPRTPPPTDAPTRLRALENAERTAIFQLEEVDKKLRELRIDFPRAFGTPPTPADLADRVATLERRR